MNVAILAIQGHSESPYSPNDPEVDVIRQLTKPGIKQKSSKK